MHGAGPFDVTSISLAMLANRISYHFNLMGPSITCCTACSASLTALHTAMTALHAGDCKQALAGSVNYLGTSRLSASFNALGVISPDGKCHSFDADANGYMRSEGAFIFALKPLEAAERDGDHIHAVIEATAVNAAGAADGSEALAQGRYITAPTQHAQVDLMRTACARAGRAPGEFDYIEAHATGTVVGDRIEGNAIVEAFGGVDRDVPLRVSSVKSNLGHMEAAAFNCALLKVVLMMQRRTFAPTSKNFVVPNPEIDFESGPLQVQTVCEPFPDRPVVVGINSFGFGGANGHCVVSEYRPAASSPGLWSADPSPDCGFMIPLSARTTGALAQSARRLRNALTDDGTDLYTVAGNLSRRRTHFGVRTGFAVRSRDELLAALDDFARNPVDVAAVDDRERRVAMVFAGQGTQWSGCGRLLWEADPVFRRVVDAVDGHWREHSDIPLRDACFSAPQHELDEVRLAQPAIFMIQCALFELFKTWGVHPECVVGHSSGEVAAAYASGALTLAEATRLVYHRATLQQQVAGSGRMLAVGLDLPGAERLLESLDIAFRPDGDRQPQVEIACENAPASVVLCGREAELEPVIAELDRRNLQNRLLAGNIAFHSSAMDPVRADAKKALAFLNPCAFNPGVPFVSSVTGEETERLDGAYWWTNIRHPVRFARAIHTIVRDYRPDVFLEIAPHSALQSALAQCLEEASPAPAMVPSLHRNSDDRLGFQEALASLYRHGVALDFEAQYPRPRPMAHLLPRHPREDQKTMDIYCDDEFLVQQGQYSHGPLVGHRVPSEHPLFEARLSEKDFPWLADHRVHHAAIMPAAGYIEMVLQALEGASVRFEVLEFLQPCPIPTTPVRLQTALNPVPDSADEYRFTISSRPFDVDAVSEVHCRGRVAVCETVDVPAGVPARLDEIDRSSCETVFASGIDFYEQIDAVLSETFQYGPCFRTLRLFEVDPDSRDLIVDIEMDEELWETGRKEGYVSGPPALLDGGLQIFLSHLLTVCHLFAIPQRAEGVTFLRPPTGPGITCRVTKPDEDWVDANERGQYSVQRGERAAGSISFYDRATGQLCLHIGQYTYFTSDPRWSDLPNSKHEIRWQPKFIPGAQSLLQRLPDGEIEPAVLLAALERPEERDCFHCHVVEFAGAREPGETVLAECLDYLTGTVPGSEFWLLSNSEETARAHYEAFSQQDAALRFECLDPDIEPSLNQGLLRPGGAEIVFLHGTGDLPGVDGWQLLRRLMVAGGLALVRHDDCAEIEPGEGWTTLRAGVRATLLQAPLAWVDETSREPLPGPRWVLGEASSWAEDWTRRLDATGTIRRIPHETLRSEGLDSVEWSRAEGLAAIDYFCGADADDVTGEAASVHFIGFVQALVSARQEGADRVCRLTVVTRRASMDVEHPRGSALWGAVRSMAMEVGDEAMLDFRLVDLGDMDDLNTLEWLARRDLRERELAVRKNRLWVPRIGSLRERYARVPPGEDAAHRLTLDNPGQITGLEMKTCEPLHMGPDDVLIEVRAAALNFRDVMVTLGLLPALAYERSALGHSVGMEGSGIVQRTGTGARHFAPGDEVAFIAGGCIANRAVVPEHLVFRKPDRLSTEEAASALSVYVTAYYSLIHLARLRKGQRVLIHSAMGGVGQAAIALARHVGAEIYTTAGSESKREQLMEMGARGAFDSHSHDWYDDLMAATGEGVDVVLNSLAGRHVELCLRALRPGGWHCEIGKIDIYADNDLGLRVFRKNLRFAAIDVDRLMLDDPHLTRELSEACMDLLDRGAVPPLPVTVFPYRDYRKALRLMTTGRHQGKLVLKAPEATASSGYQVADVRPVFDPDATYLVTGGFGGVGLRLIPYLVASGARHLTLLDRDTRRRRDAGWIRRSSALVYMDAEPEFHIVQGDVAVEEDVRGCIRQIERPLKGVFHLAGVLDDRLLDDLTPESVRRVFAPKATGALHLHRATAGHDLDHFVLFSSTASMLGNMGQINYSAANGFLDGLAAHRHRQGLPCLTYNMPAVADAGMAARSLPVLRMMRAAGIPPVSSDLAIANLDYALRAMPDRPHLVTSLFQRPTWTVDFPDYMRIGRVMHNQDAFEKGSGAELTVDSVVDQIVAKVAELCGHDDGEVDEPLSSFGLTSVSVAELGTFIQAEFGYRVSALELMTTASCLSLAEGIVHGQDQPGQDDAETDGQDAERAAEVFLPRARRTPSPFANAPEDHFAGARTALSLSPADRRRGPGEHPEETIHA